MCRTYPILGSLIAAALLASAVRGQDLAVARQALTDYQREVSVIEGTFEKRIDDPPDEKVPDAFQRFKSTTHFTIDFRSGSYRREEIRTWKMFPLLRERPFQIRTILVRDEERSAQLKHTFTTLPISMKQPADIPHEVRLSPPVEEYSSLDETPWRYGPWHVRRFGNESLRGLLLRPDARFQGIESVDGHACWKVTLPESQYTLWLDPKTDFLPRLQIDEGRSACTVAVPEFQKHQDSKHGKERWFPARLRIDRPGSRPIHITVSRLALNPQIESERYRIDEDTLPPGVVIQGEGNQLRHTGEWTDYDVYKDRQRLMDEDQRTLQARLPKAPPPAAPLPPTKVPKLQDPWDNLRMWVAGLGGLALLLLAASLKTLRASPVDGQPRNDRRAP